MLKIAAEHIDVAGPTVKGIARSVDAYECMARFDPIQKSLFVGNRQIACCTHKNHAIVIFQ